jgi:hypothetical protein
VIIYSNEQTNFGLKFLRNFQTNLPTTFRQQADLRLMESLLSITAKRKYENKRSRNRKVAIALVGCYRLGCLIY